MILNPGLGKSNIQTPPAAASFSGTTRRGERTGERVACLLSTSKPPQTPSLSSLPLFHGFLGLWALSGLSRSPSLPLDTAHPAASNPAAEGSQSLGCTLIPEPHYYCHRASLSCNYTAHFLSLIEPHYWIHRQGGMGWNRRWSRKSDPFAKEVHKIRLELDTADVVLYLS